MIRRQIIYAVCAMLALLGACRQAPIGRLEANVVNTPTDIAPELCEGGLKAVVRIDDIELFNETVPANSEVARDTNELSLELRPLYQGVPVVVEARCFDDLGDEVGYIKTSGKLNLYSRSDSVNIYPYAPDAAASLCSPGTRRGRFPCVADGDLVQ